MLHWSNFLSKRLKIFQSSFCKLTPKGQLSPTGTLGILSTLLRSQFASDLFEFYSEDGGMYKFFGDIILFSINAQEKKLWCPKNFRHLA